MEGWERAKSYVDEKALSSINISIFSAATHKRSQEEQAHSGSAGNSANHLHVVIFYDTGKFCFIVIF